MASPSPSAGDSSFLNHPFVTTITGSIVHLQKHNIFSKERFNLLKHHFLITIGFLVLLYCLIHIQILFFWLIKLIFRSVIRVISIIFWFPLKFARFFIPKSIDYDILFPLFWLCSIVSFYLSKNYHEIIWEWFNQYLVRRYSFFQYDQSKREEVKRWIFVSTFVSLLLLQSIFILLPITLSIRQQHQEETTTKIPVVKTTSNAKAAVKEAVETMGENFYQRFIQAFEDENDTDGNEKHSPLLSDEKLEDTVKAIQRSIKKKIDQLNMKKEEEEEEKKSSRFQRWVMHYLSAPFRKWEKKSNEREREAEEEESQLDSSSDFDEEHNTLMEKMKHLREKLKNKISSSNDEESDHDESDEVQESTVQRIKDKLSKPMEQAQTLVNQLRNKIASSDDEDEDDDDDESGYESDEEDDDEESPQLTERIKQTFTQPIEKVKNIASNIKNKIISPKDEESDTESSTLTENIQERLTEPLQAVKDLGEKTMSDVKSKFSSLVHTDEEESKIESDEEEEDDDQPSILNRVKENVFKPLETTATKIRDKFSSHEETDDDDDEESFIERTRQTAEKLVAPIKVKADQLKHQVENFTEEIIEQVHEKADRLKESLPSTDQIKSKVKDQILDPIEDKATELKTTVVKKLKSLKRKKKGKTLTEKAKEKFRSLNKSVQKKLPGQNKKKKNKLQLHLRTRLNGWIDDAWNIWHLTKTKLGHIFHPSTAHARLLPRYNTTSLYTAFTDTHCYDYTKKFNRYRLLKRKYSHFLDLYRHHSPFPVYLSVLKSNGPRCYRQYPNSSCGVFLKTSQRNFKVQLYRFVRFWAIIGVIAILFAVIYQNFIHRQQRKPSDDSDRSSPSKQTTSSSIITRTDSSKPSQRPSSINQQTVNTNLQPLDKQIESDLRQWLEREENDGYQHLSETCRIAMNNTFLKQLERLSVETLQFAHAKVSNVSQNNNHTASATPAERIIINARLDIDHLILNIVNTFQEKHFSVETPKLFGQIYVLLSTNPNQYSIEVHLQQIQIKPVNIIDLNEALSIDEKKNMTRLLDDTIKRTVVRCSFRLSDQQENTNPITSPTKASIGSPPDTTKIYSSSIQTNVSTSRQTPTNQYHHSEPLPTLVVSSPDPRGYQQNSLHDIEPKRLLVRVVKAVKLHNVENPYCILEINHPKQIQQTNIANNGLNPFWDERFLFECDEKSNQIHLQIIDRKATNKRPGSNYTDTLYADVTIPFSYVTSTVYKQDVQINPQHPESIIRIEFSTLSEEEALAANNGYDVESLTESQTWTYNEREANKLEQEYSQRYQQTPSNDYLSSSYDNGSLPQHYGLSTSLYTDERDYASTLPRSMPNTSPFSPSTPISPLDGGNGKAQKSKSFMSSLKHLTLPRRKPRSKDKRDNSMSSQTSSNSQLNTSLQSPSTNTVSHSLSSALPGPYPNEYFLSNPTEVKPIRRSRSISQSFKNLFRSNSKKKNTVARTDALAEFGNVDHRNYLSTSTPTSKKLSFLHRRKSKPKGKDTNLSSNSLASYDYARTESIRDTPIRANVGHPVTMTKSTVR